VIVCRDAAQEYGALRDRLADLETGLIIEQQPGVLVDPGA
jgi:hypothetical protein